jgi:uncharacterized protein YbjQ (UPF0145 family)
MTVTAMWVTTAFDFEGYRVVANRPELCEHAREEAFALMVQHASRLGANAIIGMRYDANEIATGVTGVLGYGAAVVVEALPR